jgi:hypothetical protein
MWAGYSWLRIRSGDDFSEHGDALSGSVNGGGFVDQLSDYQLLKKDSASWS